MNEPSSDFHNETGFDSSLQEQSTKLSLSPKGHIGRKGLERLDLLLVVIEALDLNSSDAMLWTAKQIGFEETFPNSVSLWKVRSHNPLRKAHRRGNLSSMDIDALIHLVCSLSKRLYPLLHQLLSSKEPSELSRERWLKFDERFKDLIKERMNTRRVAIQNILTSNESMTFNRNLVLTLALSSGLGGFDRLRASLLDPSN